MTEQIKFYCSDCKSSKFLEWEKQGEYSTWDKRFSRFPVIVQKSDQEDSECATLIRCDYFKIFVPNAAQLISCESFVERK